MDMQFYFDCQAWTFFASLIMAYPLGSLVDRFHPLRACMVVITLSFLDCLWAGIWARDIHTFAIAFVSSTVIGGMWWTVSSSIGLRLLPRANFAQFGSAGGIIGSLGTIALAAVVGPILDYSHHTYRYTFLMSAGLAALGLAGMFIVHAKFMALGGPKNYVAPD
jgi:MFS family permease